MIDILTIMRGQSEAERYPLGPIIERETGEVEHGDKEIEELN